MKIGELAATTGTSVRLLRYYEEQGLLEPYRLDSGHRRYGDSAPAVVRRIRALLDAGLPTRVIRDLQPCIRQDGTVAGCKLETLQEHLEGLDDRISALSETRTSLAGLISATQAREQMLV
ncbi:MerR family transcriptional regulator [Streptomyces sp. NBC_00234]|uniref:MerR family transcriptional regulator n=1 Tax=Streptomyces sp. NBC_00234 TaxID=2903638 RepID=UPI002E28D5F7|nr:MerR family transcriptional regulator [Streptomyces sp. NBC_00234]